MIRHLSLLFAILIITSVIKPSLYTHYCCGRIAGIKFSFSKVKPSCCKETEQDSRWDHILNPSCCHGESMTYSVDQNYKGSSFQYNLSPIIHYINLPGVFTSKLEISELPGFNIDIPPDANGLLALSVLCIFRI